MSNTDLLARAGQVAGLCSFHLDVGVFWGNSNLQDGHWHYFLSKSSIMIRMIKL